ncbi:hypothetical protein BFW01_g3262 [Lasiodiplodia theobromae]|uniref:Aconitate hydratase 1 n=1 Tax=Lasiodiplodia theobromae TaxID=45133 RepID=UPI0015C390A8|nr:Aconitate hydratase 1 [Lasiodiplodia theobromae]KAF4541064.1 Aconitate hydratase 1 [Lasiodiplodia theobromae]KAF9632400.1 hypothetical protein BFW01_g3262 [Lasiodiplodia theobromae]
MVLIKKICPPERRKATIAVSASPSSPTLSINNNQQDFQLRISLRIAETTRPGQAITISTNGTVFAPLNPAGQVDTLSRGTVSLAAVVEPPVEGNLRRYIQLGNFKTHEARRESPPADLKERPWVHLLTIPAEGSVEVAHDLPVSRIFRHEEKLTKEDVVGESWRFRLNDGYVGTTWWCWGDLEGDLKEKRLSPWHEGMLSRSYGEPKPDVDDGWVLGCNPVELIFEDQTAGAEFQFVE